MRVTVRKKKRPSGLLGSFLGLSYEVVRDKEVLATIAQTKGGWYWYGLKNNTCDKPKSFEECRKEAVAAVKEQKQ